MPEAIAVVGVGADGAPLGAASTAALARAALVVGGREHLALAPVGARTVVLGADLGAAMDAIADEPGSVCVLASGDPGFFGIVRPLAERFGPDLLDVHPAPSSIAVAFGRLGIPWDDAAVVSAHGRPLAEAVSVAARAAKVAVLTSPANPPEAVGAALVAAGVGGRQVAVCSRLGTSDEAIVRTDLAGLAAGAFDGRSVVVLLGSDPVAPTPSLAWGRPVEAFAHRRGMITKAEVRAVVLGKLALPPAGVLWDVGAGSASVAIEAASLAPGLKVYAVERDTEDAHRARVNAADHGVTVDVVTGEAPAVLADLPDPDRVFIGGGGLDVLASVLDRLVPGGQVVATYAAMDRAAAAEALLGNLVQVTVARGERLADGGLRLDAHHPVFVVWGPEP